MLSAISHWHESTTFALPHGSGGWGKPQRAEHAGVTAPAQSDDGRPRLRDGALAVA